SEDGNKPDITVRDITLNRGLYIDGEQFLSHAPWWALWREDRPRFYANEPTTEVDESSTPDDRRSWRELRRAFDLAKNVELRNYAEYKLRLSDETSHDVWTRISGITSRWFWGYGLRPIRVLLWLAVSLLAFAG